MYRRLSSPHLSVRVSSSSHGSFILYKSFLYILYFYDYCVCAYAHMLSHVQACIHTHACHDMDVEVRGQFSVVDFLQCGFSGLNSGRQACLQASSSVEPPCRL